MRCRHKKNEDCGLLSFERPDFCDELCEEFVPADLPEAEPSAERISPVVRSNATQTTKYFWNCECERDYIHPRNTGFCDKCKTRREYQPNSRIDEVVKIMIAKG